MKHVKLLTQSRIIPFWTWPFPASNAFCPVMSSRSNIPNPKTSVFSEDCPVERYSGAMCPTVPRTAVVTCDSLWSNSLARPKSPTTASKLSSSKMFAALTSLWIIFGLHCSCKYTSPRAAPSAMHSLLFQSNDGLSRQVSVYKIKLQWGLAKK